MFMSVNQKKGFYFIAIGGVGMSALAKYLAEKGCHVCGSDSTESKYTHLLEDKGIKVFIGHNAANINKDMIIVASSAVKQNNPEIQKAQELNLKINHRSDILKMISDEFSERKDSYFIGFSGTHGKTTTSGLCSYILNRAGYNPSYVVGGIIPELNTNGEYNQNKYFIAELDESDGTIEKYSADISVINNLEEDHLDFYTNGFQDIVKTFNKFLLNKPRQKVIINMENTGCQKFIAEYPDYNYITFGLKNGDYTAENIKYKGLGSSFDILYKGKKENTISLSIPGEHNIYNAIAVYAAIKEAGVDTKKTIKYFKEFSGMGRRFQKVCDINNIKIYDDYAHHPSEIKTTLKSIKNALKSNQRLIAIFQPHRYTRLKSLWEEFKTAFDYADKLLITDVYSAGEDEIKNISSNIFAKEIMHKDVQYIQGNMQECADKIFPLLKSGDIVITLGAGTITKLGSLLENKYKGGK